jgi:hypothetical protein
MAKSLADRAGLIGGIALLALGILLVVGALSLDVIVGIGLIVVGALGIVKNI